jgi:hypothetical protein
VALLLESIHQLTQAAAQHLSNARAAEYPAQISGRRRSGAALGDLSRYRRALPPAAEHLGNLVPVLVPRDREEPQQRCHGRISAAHIIILVVRSDV